MCVVTIEIIESGCGLSLGAEADWSVISVYNIVYLLIIYRSTFH